MCASFLEFSRSFYAYVYTTALWIRRSIHRSILRFCFVSLSLICVIICRMIREKNLFLCNNYQFGIVSTLTRT